jgi:hypothetical protein
LKVAKTELNETEYQLLVRYAEQHKLTVREALRRAAQKLILNDKVYQEDPIFRSIQRASKPGRKTRWSSDHDKILYSKPGSWSTPGHRQTTADMAGSGAKQARVSDMKRLLDRMRAEDAESFDKLIRKLMDKNLPVPNRMLGVDRNRKGRLTLREHEEFTRDAH